MFNVIRESKMSDELVCGDFGLTYCCKYVICVKQKYYRAAFLFNTGCFYSFCTRVCYSDKRSEGEYKSNTLITVCNK